MYECMYGGLDSVELWADLHSQMLDLHVRSCQHTLERERESEALQKGDYKIRWIR